MFSKLGAVIIRGATLLLGVFSVTIIAPFLGISDLGRFALIQSIVAWTSLLALGLPETCSGIISKFHQKHAYKKSKFYLDNSFLVVAACAAILAGPLLFLALPWSWKNATLSEFQPFAIGLGLALLALPFSLIQALLNANGEIARSMAWSFLTSALTVAFMLAVIHILKVPQSDRLLTITAAYGLAMLIARVSMYLVESRRAFRTVMLSKSFSVHRLKFLSKSAYPFLILNAAALAAFQVDRVVSFYFLSPEDTAKLDVAMKVLMAVYALNSVFVAKLWHTIGQAWNANDSSGTRAILRQAVSTSALYWVCMGGLIILTIDPIVHLFTRGAVELNDPFFVVTAVAYIAARGIIDTVSISIFATRNQHKTVVTVLTHGLLNVPFSIAGCLAFGLPGIMIAQLVSLLITTGWKFPIVFWQVTKDRS